MFDKNERVQIRIFWPFKMKGFLIVARFRSIKGFLLTFIQKNALEIKVTTYKEGEFREHFPIFSIEILCVKNARFSDFVGKAQSTVRLQLEVIDILKTKKTNNF